jgi:mRNA interferase YafQ
MRRIERTGAFRRDYKREKRGHFRREVDSLVSDVVSHLVDDKSLPDKNHHHALSGAWSDHRECHLRPDLLLIYRKPGPEILQLVRLGSHSELFG